MLSISYFLCPYLIAVGMSLLGFFSELQAEKLLPEHYLRKKIFDGYDARVFPAPVKNQTLDINITASVASLEFMVMKSMVLSFNCMNNRKRLEII